MQFEWDEAKSERNRVVRGLMLQCVNTDRGQVRRIISLRQASRRERNGYRSAPAD
jgi:uncharacterized DUF497 family protein